MLVSISFNLEANTKQKIKLWTHENFKSTIEPCPSIVLIILRTESPSIKSKCKIKFSSVNICYPLMNSSWHETSRINHIPTKRAVTHKQEKDEIWSPIRPVLVSGPLILVAYLTVWTSYVARMWGKFFFYTSLADYIKWPS